jgi:hypothetical protein
MTQHEAMEVARLACVQRGWPWTPEVIVTQSRRFFFLGPKAWVVVTNYPRKSGNARISVDDLTGRVIRASFSGKR